MMTIQTNRKDHDGLRAFIEDETMTHDPAKRQHVPRDADPVISFFQIYDARSQGKKSAGQAGGLTAEQLNVARLRLSKLTEAELLTAYNTALKLCRMQNGTPPRAASIQYFMACWKEMERRRRAAAKTSS